MGMSTKNIIQHKDDKLTVGMPRVVVKSQFRDRSIAQVNVNYGWTIDNNNSA